MKAKVNRLEGSSKNKNIQEMFKDINDFKQGYHLHAYVIKKHASTVVTGIISILNRWERFHSKLLNVLQNSNLEGNEIFVELNNPEPSVLIVELVIEKLKKTTPRIDQLSSKLIQADVR